jgi:hypothetical protein
MGSTTMFRRPMLAIVAGASLLCVAAAAQQPMAAAPAGAAEAERFRDDARSIETLVNRTYAYLDRFEGGVMPMSDRLRAERDAVNDRRSLLHYAERALLALADHHAITGASFDDSWAIVPTYADLWIGQSGGGYAIEAVRDDSPAARAGIRPGDRLVAVDGVVIAAAVAAFWADVGLAATPERAAFAARVLAAGRRDRPRRLTIERATGARRTLDLANLYAAPHPDRPPLTASEEAGALVIRFHDSLGDQATIAAFDAAMARARPSQRVTIDLRDTPSGGNSSVARAILGWFVRHASGYQVHNLPAEERETGIARQWIEQVLPRAGKYHAGRVEVRVGRWTGSMGEGLAIGFDAIGAAVRGGRMAGLRGAVYDVPLGHSGLVIKLPAERLTAPNGTPREDFVPRAG